MRLFAACVLLLGCARSAQPPNTPAPAPSSALPHDLDAGLEPTEAGASTIPTGSGALVGGATAMSGGPYARVTFTSAGVLDHSLAMSMWRFRGCYLRTLESLPTTEGQVRLELMIAPDGKVISSRSVGSDVPQKLEDCVTNACWMLGIAEGTAGTYTFNVLFELRK